MKDMTWEITAGAMGGLAGGAVLSAAFLLLERHSGKPSDLVLLERKSAARLGISHRRDHQVPGLDEQILSHGGHLALSAVVGAAYVPLKRQTGLSSLPTGILLGVGLYTLAWGMAGPVFGVTKTPRREGPARVTQRLVIHAAFGSIAALVAERLRQRE